MVDLADVSIELVGSAFAAEECLADLLRPEQGPAAERAQAREVEQLADLGRVQAELVTIDGLQLCVSQNTRLVMDVDAVVVALGGEEGLFQEAFRARGLSRQDVANLEYLPTTLNYSGYLRRRAYEGTFIEVIATLLAVEWPYLDWAQRLEAAGKHPNNHYYQTWIDIHTSEGMSGFVDWLRHTVDAAEISTSGKNELQTIFRDVLRYEVLFFDMAYRGEAWPQ